MALQLADPFGTSPLFTAYEILCCHLLQMVHRLVLDMLSCPVLKQNPEAKRNPCSASPLTFSTPFNINLPCHPNTGLGDAHHQPDNCGLSPLTPPFSAHVGHAAAERLDRAGRVAQGRVGTCGRGGGGLQAPRRSPLRLPVERRCPGSPGTNQAHLPLSVTRRSETDANGYPQITSFGGKPLIEAHPNNKQARLEHIPICGAISHPDNGRILHLAGARMRLKEYSCVNVSKIHLVPRQHLVPYDRDQVHKLHKDSLRMLKEAISHLPHTKHTGLKHGQHGIDRGGDSKSNGQAVTGHVVVVKQLNVDEKKHKAAKPTPAVSNGEGPRVPVTNTNNQGLTNGTGPGGGFRDDIHDGGRDEGGDANYLQPGASQGPVKENQGESTGSSIKPGKTRSRAKGGSQDDSRSSFRQSSPRIQRSLTPNQHAGIVKASVVSPGDQNATESEPEELPETAGEHLRGGGVGPRQEGGLVIQALHPEGLTWAAFWWCLPAFLFLLWVAYLALCSGP